MKKIVFLVLYVFLFFTQPVAFGQIHSTESKPKWNHDLEGWLYLMPDQVIFSPIYGLDRDWLHLEARYNYEDLNTFSAWFGYNLSGGKNLEYTFTPMLGGLVGNLNGLSPGLEINLDFHRFNFNSSSQYVFDFKDRTSDFYYNWTDLSYAPLDWMSFGLSIQRTRLYRSSLDPQFGAMLDFTYRWFELSSYWYNPFRKDPYFVIALYLSFPEN
ncbi:hypothetical protein DFQ04_2355 [Algoriphagus boseongensis]|uniref:Uncharacterized protein n=1 Tax=Algoriphagus boseongensis TaxID=1442587 RepID=A0A4V3D201_9BACT|nr:hypothetical protein [Algoriphagus boseongensis]TDQ16243.1 hypothetical protein DFQ04_2355 [Algoriphagus boseongensis]